MGTADNENSLQKKLANQSINYWKIAKILLSRWYWVAGTLAIGYVMARLYIRSTPPVFYTQAQLKLDNGDNAQMSGVAGLNYRYYKPNIIQTEGIIIRSEDVIIKAIEQLGYNVTYYLEGRVLTSELYPYIPFNISIIKQDSLSFSRATYEIKRIDQAKFQLSSSDNPNVWATYRYGQLIDVGNMVFSVVSPIPNTGKYKFRFNSPADLFSRAVGGLNTFEQDKNTNIMTVSHTDQNKQFSSDLLNAIIKQYVTNDAELKKRSAIQTIDYLNSQIGFLDSVVNKSGDKLADFQTKNSVIDPTTDKQINSSRLSSYQELISGLQLQEINIIELENQLKSNRDQAPLNLDLTAIGNTALNAPLINYNELVSQRILKLKEFNPGSRAIIEIDKQLADSRRAIAAAILQLHETNTKAINFYKSQLGRVNQSLNQIPKNQNDFTKLEKNLESNQTMYNMLFERKLSAQIARAAVIPSATIISYAQPGNTPISPIPRKIITSYLFFGFLAGLGLIVLIRIINPYIYDVETVEGLTTTPIIGVILKYPERMDGDFKRILSLDKPKSVFSESVRSVRTNLSFMASQKTNKVICVTSEISGEGKSFVTINLAGTLAIIDKKVIVIAGDLRRSKLHKTFGSDNKKGLSTYLSNKNTLEEIIGRDVDHEIDYITSGPVPPNPSELLHSVRMKDMITELKKTYEYIIIDTAPIGLVSDSVPLIREADINLFIIRSGVSMFRAASIPERLSKEYSLNNIAIILNSFGNEKLHANIYSTNYTHGNVGAYYYSDYTGYGNYGYYEDGGRKKWWQIWKK